ncbi:glycosyltransferase family 4 protein [Patescibacteria group bacterium]|nr:glycosyltransferase family 4 protein [Patescibacteria group bacterium]
MVVKNNKKITILSSVYPNDGGMGTVFISEILGFIKNGNLNIKILVPKYNKYFSSRIKRFTEFLNPIFKIGMGAICLNVNKKIKDSDIIYLHYPAFGIAENLLFYKKRKNQKIIIRYHMDLMSKNIFKKIFYKINKIFILPKILKKADKVIFSSFDYAKISDAKKYYIKNKSKCLEIPFGVDKKVFFAEKNRIKKKQLLFVGHLDKAHDFKGIENLINAFSKIKNNDFNLVIMGRDGDYRNKYQNLVKKLNLIEKVKFYINLKREDMRNIYNESYFTILPSTDKREAFGMVLIESLECGTPIIASNLNGVRSLVLNKRNGFLIYNIFNIQKELENILKINDLEYKKLEEYCINNTYKYSWKRISDKLINIFSE